MSLQLPFGLQLVNPTPVDYYYGPWADLSTALAGLPSGIRYKGQTVGIYNMGSVEEYWFKDGITDPDLVAKIPDLSPYQLVSEKGQANGYTPLNGSSKVDAIYLPSYVDDVEEYINFATFPLTGETGKIYTALDTNKIYRWSGSIYVEISPNVIPSWNAVLTAGRITDGVNPFISAGDAIEWHNTTANAVTTLTNDQTVSGAQTIYLPQYSGRIAYHSAGSLLTQNYMVKGGANGILSSSTVLYDDGTNIGIGTNAMAAKLDVRSSLSNGLVAYYKNTNNSTSTFTRVQLDSFDANIGMILGAFGSNYTTNANFTNSVGIRSYNSNLDILISGNLYANFGSMRFGYYIENTNTYAEFGRFLKSGEFGLGITNPTAKLHVASTSGTAFQIDTTTYNSNFAVYNNGHILFGSLGYQQTGFYYNRKNGYDGDFWFNPSQTNGGISSNIYMNALNMYFGAPSASSGFAQAATKVKLGQWDGVGHVYINPDQYAPSGSTIPLSVGYWKGSSGGLGSGYLAQFVYNNTVALNTVNSQALHGILIDLSQGTYTNSGSGVASQIGLKIIVGGSELNNALQLIDGSQGVGKVLTSDANGIASWQTLSGTDTNFANTDLTLSANRSHNLNSFNLGFVGGNVGIGTATPTHNLTVNSTSSTGFIGLTSTGVVKSLIAFNTAGGQIYLTEGGGGADRFSINYATHDYVNTGKNFGIGTTTPVSKLTVVSNLATDYMGIYPGSGGGAFIGYTTTHGGIIQLTNAAGNYNTVRIGLAISGVQTNDWINTGMNFGIGGFDATGSNIAAKLHIKSSSGTAFRVDGSGATNNFYVSDGGVVNSRAGYYQTTANGDELILKVEGLSGTTLRVGSNTASPGGYSNIFIGRFAGSASSGNGNTFVGTSIGVSNIGTNNTAMGWNTFQNAQTSYAVAIGSESFRDGVSIGYAVGIGAYSGSVALGSNNIFIGYNANVTSPTDQTLGSTAQTYSNGIAIGHNAKLKGNNQMVIYGPTEMYLGQVSNLPVYLSSFKITTTSIVEGYTDGSAAASILYIDGARGTGTGVGGDIIFRTAPAGSTGSSQNALVSRMHISQNGNVGIGTTSPSYNLDVINANASGIIRVKTTFATTSSAGFYVENSSNASLGLYKYGNGVAGTFTGVSIPYAGKAVLTSLTSGGSYDEMVVGGSVIYGLTATTASPNNLGFRQDVNGFRIGRIDTIHNANTNAFEVNYGNSYFSGVAGTANALVHIKSSSGSSFRIDGSSINELINVRDNGTTDFYFTTRWMIGGTGGVVVGEVQSIPGVNPFVWNYHMYVKNTFQVVNSAFTRGVGLSGNESTVGALVPGGWMYSTSSVLNIGAPSTQTGSATLNMITSDGSTYQTFMSIAGGSGVLTIFPTYNGGVVVGGSTKDASAKLQIDSTTQGVLMPRMTTTEINAIASPANGLMVYNTTLDHVCFYQNGAWEKLSHSPM